MFNEKSKGLSYTASKEYLSRLSKELQKFTAEIGHEIFVVRARGIKPPLRNFQALPGSGTNMNVFSFYDSDLRTYMSTWHHKW